MGIVNGQLTVYDEIDEKLKDAIEDILFNHLMMQQNDW